MDVDPHLPSSFTQPTSSPVVDAQGLQNYLVGMQTEFANQLHQLSERLEAMSHPAASSTSTNFHAGTTAASHTPFTRTTAVSHGERTTADTSLGKLLHKPSTYHGEHGNRVYDWLSELESTFDNPGPTPDQVKINFARQCLRDEAQRWWSARQREVLHSQQRRVWDQQGLDGAIPEAKENHQTKAINTWLEFKQAFVDYFCPRGASEAARNQLHALRQNQFRRLDQYCDQFEKVARLIQVAPGHDITEELIVTFKNGLSDGRIRLHLKGGRVVTCMSM